VVLDHLGETFRRLLHDGQAHREMKPIEEMLGLWVEIQLEISDRIAAIREKRELLVHLMALRLQHLEQAPFRFRIESLHKPKALAGRNIFRVLPSEGEDTLADNDFEL